MPQSLVQIYVHVVFSTKNRFPFFVDDEISKSTHAYLGGICKRLGAPVLKVGGALDHVHILCLLPRERTIANLVWEIKRGSSKWLKSKGPKLANFFWQRGYGRFLRQPVPPRRALLLYRKPGRTPSDGVIQRRASPSAEEEQHRL